MSAWTVAHGSIMMARRAVHAGLRTKTQTFATLRMRGASVSGGALDLNITTAGGRSARAGAESGGRRQGRVEVGGARTGSCKLSVAVINPALNPGADVDEHADGAPTPAFQRESGAAMAWASRATKADFNPSADRLRLVNSALSSGTRIPGTSCSVYEGSGALRAGEGVSLSASSVCTRECLLTGSAPQHNPSFCRPGQEGSARRLHRQTRV